MEARDLMPEDDTTERLEGVEELLCTVGAAISQWQLAKVTPEEEPDEPQGDTEAEPMSEPRSAPDARCVRRGVIDGREHLLAGLENVEIRDSGAGSGYFTLRGHAAMFSTDSEDLGGFIERLTPGCFAEALRSSTVHLVWQHDMSMPLASTESGTLELREDDLGLQVWARIPNTLSYAQDIRTLFENGIATGMSFAFTLPEDGSGETWTRTSDGTPLRTITRVAELFDVSCVSRGAYRQPAFSMRSVIDAAVESGRLPEGEGASPVAQADPAGDSTQEVDERARALAAQREDVSRRLRLARARSRQ